MSTRAEQFVRSPELANFARYNSQTTTIKLLLKCFRCKAERKTSISSKCICKIKTLVDTRYKLKFYAHADVLLVAVVVVLLLFLACRCAALT